MSCHTFDGSIFVCLTPIMGAIAEDEWIRRELETIKQTPYKKRKLERRLAELQGGSKQ